jgi:hypothetical protein
MLWNILVAVILMYLSYRAGRCVGYVDAVSHSDKNFWRMLVATKRQMDRAILKHCSSDTVPQQVLLTVNERLVFVGSPEDLAQRSIEVGELITHIEKVCPEATN